MSRFSNILNSFFGVGKKDIPRPRFGRVIREDGTSEPVVFHQVKDRPTIFVPKLASTEEIVYLGPGDKIKVDVLGPGQSISFELRPGLPEDYDG